MPIRYQTRPVILGGYVISFNGRVGPVVPIVSDYNAGMIDYFSTIDETPVVNVAEALDVLSARNPTRKILLFSALSLLTQEPNDLDTPLQLTIGAAQGGPSDPIELDALGNLTFNEDDSIELEIRLEFGRDSNVQTAIVFARLLLNGVQVASSVFAEMDTSVDKTPVIFSIPFAVVEGDIITIEIMRDSAGTNDGGIFGAVPTVLPWASAPSVALNVFKYEGS